LALLINDVGLHEFFLLQVQGVLLADVLEQSGLGAVSHDDPAASGNLVHQFLLRIAAHKSAKSHPGAYPSARDEVGNYP
jgi:hypothetical protein